MTEMTMSKNRASIIALAFMVVALPALIIFKLLPALLAGLLVHELVHMLAERFFRGKAWGRAKIWALVIILTIIVLALAGTTIAIVLLLRSDTGSLSELLMMLAQVLEDMRKTLPDQFQQWIPSQVSDLREPLSVWLRTHAEQLQNAGGAFAHALVTSLVGMVIGALVSLQEAVDHTEPRFLASALTQSFARLADAFRRVVFAQVRISALNTLFTSIYLLALLPIIGVDLPLKKTMILVTFLAGLLPVVGNLISNTVITVISLSVSWQAGLGSLAYLVVIHKLEYFINARIVGARINAAAFELLSAMVIMEAIFGMPGIVAAPIFYAYFKSELTSRDWI
jgi:predicted PurR-regulated permease PerM